MLSKGRIPDPTRFPNLSKLEQSPLAVAVKQLEVDKNVNRSSVIGHFLGLK